MKELSRLKKAIGKDMNTEACDKFFPVVALGLQ